MSQPKTLLFATDADETRRLAECLDAELSALPALDRPETFEAWRKDASTAEPRDRIVVAPWITDPSPGPLTSLDEAAWRRRFELPYLLWNFALGAAGRRCGDGGTIVAIVQTPAALDVAGFTPEMSIADGVLSLVRSIAAAEGARGVRANLVTTPIGLVEGEVILPAPPLPDFPGRIEREVAGTARLLLSPDACGLTGRVLSADGGRSL